MKQYRPSYYKDFRCIASACSDNCCIGWEIDIDAETDAFYRSIGGDFGCRLQKDILRDENGSQFILKGERCPFLNGQNLCDIYINLGESALCEICTQHPRYHEWYGDRKESGVGLCCEAAGRLIFTQDSAPTYELVEIEEEAGEVVHAEAFSALFIARETAFHLADNLQLSSLLRYGQNLQEALDDEDWNGIRELAEEYRDAAEPIAAPLKSPASLEQLLTFLSELEPIDPQWPELLLHIRENLPDILHAHKELRTAYPKWTADMKQLLHYFLFRYFCKALFDGDVLSKTTVPLLACVVISLLDGETFLRKGSFTLEDRIFTAKQFSKEIEYCTENMNALCDAVWDEEFLSPEQIAEQIALFFA